MIIQLLSQIDAFTSSVCTLDRPILQPESRFMPLGVNRDPRATVVARERLEALAIEHGVNIAVWGKALETVTESEYP